MTNEVIRIPNLPIGKMVGEDGVPTQQELTFRQTLITSLQDNFGNQGMVAPSQDAASIAAIAANKAIDPLTGQLGSAFTCAPGTILYNSDNNTLMVAILVGSTPTFKTFTVT